MRQKIYFSLLFQLFSIFHIFKHGFCIDLTNVVNSFNRDTIQLKLPPFCIIRHQEDKKKWVDYYLSYDKKKSIMYIQKNKEEPVLISNFQSKENFVMCYESTLVENQITLISLQKNYTYYNTPVFQNGQFLGIANGLDAPQAIITEYQFNITSQTMINAGNPIRYSNDTNYHARYSIQIEIVRNGTTVDYKQYGLGPIPNFDFPFHIYQRPNGTYYAPDLFFFQYSYNYNQFYAQQFNVLENRGGQSTLHPQLDDPYSVIYASTVNITNNIFKQISTPSQVLNFIHPPLFALNEQGCFPDVGEEYQPINDQYLMIRKNSSYAIIDRKDYWNFFYNFQDEKYGLICKFSRNETNKDLYYYDLGYFELSSKDWLGVIVIEEEEEINYLLTQAVFDKSEETLQAYRFYQINLEKKSRPQLLTKDEDFDPISGYSFYEGFTYFRGIPIHFKYKDLNRFSMLYLVNGNEVLKLQFNMMIMLNQGNFFSTSRIFLIAYTILISFTLGCIFYGFDIRQYRRQIRENINKLKKTNIKGLTLEDEHIFKNFYLPSIKLITKIEKRRQEIVNFPPLIQDNSIFLPSGSINKMHGIGDVMYSIILPEQQINNAWNFIKLIQKSHTSHQKFNEDHYLFQEMKNIIETKTYVKQKAITRLLFVIQENKYNSINLFNQSLTPLSLSNKQTQIGENNLSQTQKKDYISLPDITEDIDYETSDQIQIELILIRKFTIALKLLKRYNLLLPHDFLEYLSNDIYVSDDNDVFINPLLIFYAFFGNICSMDPIQQSENYCQSTYKFIAFLEEVKNSKIPCCKFKNFDDCLSYYDFHIGMREFQNRFKIEDSLGFGGFGKVYSVIDSKNDQKLAVKAQYLYDQKRVKQVLKEFNILKRLTFQKKENVIKICYGLMVNNVIMENSSQQQRGYNLSLFVMEKGQMTLENEMMKVKQSHFCKEEVHSMIKQLCQGLYELHTIAQVIHMDISLDNILKTTDNSYKFSDFGGGVDQGQITTTVNLTTGFDVKEKYLSPLLKSSLEEINSNYSEESKKQLKKNYQLLMKNDSYALGLVLYMVVTFDAKVIHENRKFSSQELEVRRKMLISNLEKYKSSNNQDSTQDSIYPDYLICYVQDLLNYTHSKEILESIKSYDIIINNDQTN